MKISKENIITVYQPIIKKNNNQYNLFEALGRIKFKDEIIMPDTFLSIFKKDKSYVKYSILYMSNIFYMLNQKKDMKISLNVSMLDISSVEWTTAFYEHCYSLVDKSRLWVEFLETEHLVRIKALAFMERLRQLGVKIVLDDFGSRYCNIEYLLDYPIDIIKIDGNIIKQFKNPIAKNALNFIKNVSSEYKMKVVAEHIENKEVFSNINKYNFDFFQGYYFGKPKEMYV